MSIQCAATFTLRLDLPKNPFITFRCEREVHEDGEHYTTGIGGEGQTWKMSWTENPIGTKEKGGKNVSITH